MLQAERQAHMARIIVNNNVTLAFNSTFVPGTAGWSFPTSYMNPRVTRLNAEFSW